MRFGCMVWLFLGFWFQPIHKVTNQSKRFLLPPNQTSIRISTRSEPIAFPPTINDSPNPIPSHHHVITQFSTNSSPNSNNLLSHAPIACGQQVKIFNMTCSFYIIAWLPAKVERQVVRWNDEKSVALSAIAAARRRQRSPYSGVNLDMGKNCVKAFVSGKSRLAELSRACTAVMTIIRR